MDLVSHVCDPRHGRQIEWISVSLRPVNSPKHVPGHLLQQWEILSQEIKQKINNFCRYVHYVCAYTLVSQWIVVLPGTGTADGWDLLCGLWKHTLNPLKGQQVLYIDEASLNFLKTYFKFEYSEKMFTYFLIIFL